MYKIPVCDLFPEHGCILQYARMNRLSDNVSHGILSCNRNIACQFCPVQCRTEINAHRRKLGSITDKDKPAFYTIPDKADHDPQATGLNRKQNLPHMHSISWMLHPPG